LRVIVAGSRSIDGPSARTSVRQAIRNSGFEDKITIIIHGGARRVDRIAGEVCEVRWPVKVFKANWILHGLGAGMIRNEEMANYAQGLIALWDGRSRGTKNMIDLAVTKGLKVYVQMYHPEPRQEASRGFLL